MTDKPFPFWTDQNATASFSDPGTCETRMTAFEKKVRRRNLIEYVAGGLVIAMFGVLAVIFAAAGEWLIVATALAIILAAVFVVMKLHRDGSTLGRLPEQSCREHLRDQLIRQRDLLRGVPKWYVAPFIPGLVGFYAVVSANIAAQRGWASAMEGMWVKLVLTMIVLIFVVWLNVHAAKKLDREIEALDRA